MSREIKFRAWTGTTMEYKIMAGFLGVFYVKGMSAKDSTCMSEFNTIYHPPVSVMQYTGLKDKNGKEIYEGDIVKQISCGHYWVYKIDSVGGQFGNNLYAILLYDNLTSNEDESIYTYQKTAERFGFRNYVPFGKDCEIIGNIYENPELLK